VNLSTSVEPISPLAPMTTTFMTSSLEEPTSALPCDSKVETRHTGMP
jgi:hypothetical protein